MSVKININGGSLACDEMAVEILGSIIERFCLVSYTYLAEGSYNTS